MGVLLLSALLVALPVVGGVWWVERKTVGQVQDVVDAIVGQLGKVRDEIVGEIEKLTAAVAGAGVAEEVDLSGLQAIADALDAVVPDAAEEAEVEVEYEGLDAGLVEFVEDEPVEDEDA